ILGRLAIITCDVLSHSPPAKNHVQCRDLGWVWIYYLEEVETEGKVDVRVEIQRNIRQNVVCL
ncbi:hypothetical protein TorRG33x02_188650, partial [Trema orientale]